jgi:hypothetical protein
VRTTKGESIDAHEGGGSSCSSDEVLVMGMERRGWIIWPYRSVNQKWEEPRGKVRSLRIAIG